MYKASYPIIGGLMLLLLLLAGCSNPAPQQEAQQQENQDSAIIITADPIPSTEPEKAPPPQTAATPTAKEIAAFVLPGYEILGQQIGDLNADGQEDVILIQKKPDEAETSDVNEHPEKRPLLLLTRQPDGSLQLAARNDNVVLCVDCGGVFGDPYSGIVIKGNYFSIEHYGGSSWRWTRIITFRYNPDEKYWFLHKDGSESYHTSDPDKVETTVKTVKDFGKVRFDAFDVYAEQ